MRQIILLLSIFLIMSCNKDSSKDESPNIRCIYDKQSFKGEINGNPMQIQDTLGQFGFRNDLLDIEGYKTNDSVLWRFGNVIKDNNSNTSIQIHFFIRELFANLNTSKIANNKLKYKYLSVLKNRILTDEFKLMIDSINYDRPGYILSNNKNQKSAIIIEVIK